MKKFLILILLVLIINSFAGNSSATSLSFSFGGALRISDSLPLDNFSDLVDFNTGRIFTANPATDPLVQPGGYTSKNRVEIADLNLDGTFYVDNGGTLDPSDDYTVFPFLTSLYPNGIPGGFKVQDPSGTTDYLTANLKALSLRTHGGAGNLNANELTINLTNLNVPSAGLALNSAILTSLNGAEKGILTITMQYSGNLEYAIKSGLIINTSYSGTVSVPNVGGGGGQHELVPEPDSLLLFGFGIIGTALYMVFKKRFPLSSSK